MVLLFDRCHSRKQCLNGIGVRCDYSAQSIIKKPIIYLKFDIIK